MHRQPRRGVTIVEILTVIGVIILLLAILLPGLGILRANAIYARSQGNLRQLGTWLRAYANDNREFVIPAAFDYRASPVRGNVRTPSPPGTSMPIGEAHYGSWSDVMWSDAGLGPVSLGVSEGEYDYRFDSPDRIFFDVRPDYRTPIRSDADNTRASDGTNAFPFGTGSQIVERGQPGYFAANGFFDVRPEVGGRWYTTAQIKRPFQSLYLVDSFAGEVIRPECAPFGCEDGVGETQVEVDFRYVGDLCLMLLLDGSVRAEPRWSDLQELEVERQVRVRNLDR
jgi:type II secretory pathway pseudopilin PulG